MSRAALITGASSAIARALAVQLSREGWDLFLAGRDLDDLNRTAADLHIRFGVKVRALRFDAFNEPACHREMFERCVGEQREGIELLILCHGTLLEPAGDDRPRAAAASREMMRVNFVSAIDLLECAAAHFKPRGGGTLVGFSSVAADRARKSNFRYGASKAALSFYLAGLRHQLANENVCVLTVNPGFVDTRLTWGRPGMFLVASPERVAQDVLRAVRRGRSAVIYTPWFWRWIMLVIRSIPERVFRQSQL